MLFNSPISIEKVNQIIGNLKIDADSKVIDFGCGEGEFLTRIHDASTADCLGIDLDSSCIELAVKKLKPCIQSGKIKFVHGDVQELKLKKIVMILLCVLALLMPLVKVKRPIKMP